MPFFYLPSRLFHSLSSPHPLPPFLPPFCPPPPSHLPSLEHMSPLLDRMDGVTVIGGFDSYGFNVNGVRMRGSVLAFGNFSLLWSAATPVDVCPRSLAPLHMVRPKPELVLIGTGKRTHHVNPAVYAYMARHGIAVEVMSTVRFRFLRKGTFSPRTASPSCSPPSPLVPADACHLYLQPAAV